MKWSEIKKQMKSDDKERKSLLLDIAASNRTLISAEPAPEEHNKKLEPLTTEERLRTSKVVKRKAKK